MASDSIFSGLKVVDFSSFVAGPAAAVILSDFGAEVVKVEPRGKRRVVCHGDCDCGADGLFEPETSSSGDAG